MFNVAPWQEFFRVADAWLIDRLSEGRGVCQLQPLDAPAAQELIRARMQRMVWDLLDEAAPLTNKPIFPFTADLIQQILGKSRGELRTFLYEAQMLYEKLLKHEEPIEWHNIEPDRVWCDRETAVMIHCTNLPIQVRVFLGDKELIAKSNATDRVIEVTIPGGLSGDSQLRIESANQPLNWVSVPFHVIPLPQPVSPWIDAEKVQKRRAELKMTQKAVYEPLKLTSPKLKQLITGAWTDATDDHYLRLAEILQTPLSLLLKSTETESQNGQLLYGEPVETEESA